MKLNKKEIRKKFDDLFNYSLDLIYVHDLRGNFIDANDITLDALGYTREEIPEISFNNLIDKTQMKLAFKTMKEILQTGKQSIHSEYKIKRKDDKYIFIETYGIPLKNEGEIIGILGIGKNITVKKEFELELKNSRDELKRLNKRLEKKVSKKAIELKKSEAMLIERVKELNCLYHIIKLIKNPFMSIDEILNDAVNIIPSGFNFPNLASVQIKFGYNIFKTPNYKNTPWKLSNSTIIKDRELVINVCYLKEKTFLKEEERLLKKIGNQLRSILLLKLDWIL